MITTFSLRVRVAVALGAAALMTGNSPALAAAPVPAPDVPALDGAFPLGDRSAPRTGSTQLAAGVSYRVFTQGSASDVWSVWARFEDGQEVTTQLSSAESLAEQLRKANFTDVRVATIESPASADTFALPFYGVHVGSYGAMADASALKVRLKDAGYTSTRVFYTAETSNDSKGPWQVRVITVAPDAQVDLRTGHGGEISTSETVKELARNAGALAAVNGTEFDINSPNNHDFMGFEGVPQGLYMKDNVLLGTPNNGRTALLLNGPGGRPRITDVKSRTWITAPDGSQKDIDGINRVTGQILGCGGVGGDFVKLPSGNTPALRPLRNRSCYDPDEIVVFRPEWGATTPAPADEWLGTEVTEIVMDGNWQVRSVRGRPGPIPAGGRVLQGIGEGGDWLEAHAAVGQRFVPHSSVTDMSGVSVTSPTLSAVAGGTPALMRDGQVWLNPAANGMAHLSCTLPVPAGGCRPSGVLTARHARTLAGISRDGHLMLVTIDGRNPQYSVGVTLPEAATVMQWLGAHDAVGLGSGGDTTLVVGNSLYNRPWDEWQDTAIRERKVSNAVVVVERS